MISGQIAQQPKCTLMKIKKKNQLVDADQAPQRRAATSPITQTTETPKKTPIFQKKSRHLETLLNPNHFRTLTCWLQ